MHKIYRVCVTCISKHMEYIPYVKVWTKYDVYIYIFVCIDVCVYKNKQCVAESYRYIFIKIYHILDQRI